MSLRLSKSRRVRFSPPGSCPSWLLRGSGRVCLAGVRASPAPAPPRVPGRSLKPVFHDTLCPLSASSLRMSHFFLSAPPPWKCCVLCKSFPSSQQAEFTRPPLGPHGYAPRDTELRAERCLLHGPQNRHARGPLAVLRRLCSKKEREIPTHTEDLKGTGQCVFTQRKLIGIWAQQAFSIKTQIVSRALIVMWCLS